MKKRDKVKVIGGVKHIGNIPKSQGRLLWYVNKCPLWSMFIVVFIFIAIEMFVFACLYNVISAASFKECLDYSIFSVLGENVENSVKNSLVINRIISFQLIFTNCTISFFMAIVVYKLISIKPVLIKMEDHVVFDPTSGTLRLRITNLSKFNLTNIHVDASLRIHIPNGGKYVNAKLKLKTDTMNLLLPYTFWNISSKPYLPQGKNNARLDIKKFDSDGLYEFIPDLLNEKYRSDDEKLAKRTDFRNLDVIVTMKAPLFGTDWVYHKSFTTEDFVCGKTICAPDELTTDWSLWGKYEEMSEWHCAKCAFAGHCGIIKRSKKYKTIN